MSQLRVYLQSAMNSRQSFSAILSASIFLFVSCEKPAPVQLANALTPLPSAERSPGALVDLCDILRFPVKYENKPVRFKAYFCDCFEDATIYSTNCEIDKKICVHGSLGQKCTEAGRIDPFRSASADGPEATYGAWTFGVIGEGRLIGTNGRYGHMNAFDYLFEIDCLEHAELLDKKGRGPKDMAPEQQPQIAAFEAMR